MQISHYPLQLIHHYLYLEFRMVTLGGIVHNLACTAMNTDLKMVSKQLGVEFEEVAHVLVGAVIQSPCCYFGMHT